ncbi:hypothetical protein TNCV_2689811 [Trichonephila clavipes]|uniref:Uncharacterized protein n=1 Tax=Trichonephila clavipes TaxID=2585209 RepID=A0A8X6VYI0_TRICX|nr:hypothetical protein TNCV_2689811 [Trichonephila clavipes]
MGHCTPLMSSLVVTSLASEKRGKVDLKSWSTALMGVQPRDPPLAGLQQPPLPLRVGMEWKEVVTPKCLGNPPVDRDRRNAHSGSNNFGDTVIGAPLKSSNDERLLVSTERDSTFKSYPQRRKKNRRCLKQ